MTHESRPSPRDQKLRRWAGTAGTVAFFLLGVLVLPDLISKQPDAPKPDASSEPEPQAGEPARASEQPSSGDGEHVAATPARPSPRARETRAFDCMIAPSDLIDIGSSIIGVIDEISVDHSDPVRKGQVLARLESSVERAAVKLARARAERQIDILASQASLDLDEARQARALRLFENDAVSLDVRQEVDAQATLAALELERAREDHRLSKLELERTVAALERRTIRSPVNGFVVERMMSPGEVVDEQTILRIAKVDPLRAEAILPASWYGRMHAGDAARLVPEAPLDDERLAEVQSIDPVIDGASGTFSVHLELPNPDHDLPAGLRCQVSFLREPKSRTAALGD